MKSRYDEQDSVSEVRLLPMMKAEGGEENNRNLMKQFVRISLDLVPVSPLSGEWSDPNGSRPFRSIRDFALIFGWYDADIPYNHYSAPRISESFLPFVKMNQ